MRSGDMSNRGATSRALPNEGRAFGNDLKSFPVRQSVDRKVLAVQSKHRIDGFPLRQKDQRGIGQISVEGVIPLKKTRQLF